MQMGFVESLKLFSSYVKIDVKELKLIPHSAHGQNV